MTQIKTRSGTGKSASPVTRHPSPVRAFSLIELMITLGLISFIILGLMLMFQQVQRSFRSSMTQTDVLEAGRSVTDQIARELEQMTPTQFPYDPVKGYPAVNFVAELYGDFATDPQRQYLPGAAIERTNFVQHIFFMSKVGQNWVATGYRVLPDYTGTGLGTLYRFSTNSAAVPGRNLTGYMPPIYLSTNFLNAVGNPPAGFTQIADGIVHFRLRAFDTNGALITPNSPGMPNVLRRYELGSHAEDQVRYWFYSNAVPAYLELEIGFLESHMVDRFKALADASPVAGRNYLSNHVANVHLFRRRIPIRNVDFSAYQ